MSESGSQPPCACGMCVDCRWTEAVRGVQVLPPRPATDDVFSAANAVASGLPGININPGVNHFPVIRDGDHATKVFSTRFKDGAEARLMNVLHGQMKAPGTFAPLQRLKYAACAFGTTTYYFLIMTTQWTPVPDTVSEEEILTALHRIVQTAAAHGRHVTDLKGANLVLVESVSGGAGLRQIDFEDEWGEMCTSECLATYNLFVLLAAQELKHGIPDGYPGEWDLEAQTDALLTIATSLETHVLVFAGACVFAGPEFITRAEERDNARSVLRTVMAAFARSVKDADGYITVATCIATTDMLLHAARVSIQRGIGLAAAIELLQLK